MRASVVLHEANQARNCFSALRPLEPGRFAAAFNQQRWVGKLLPPTLLGADSVCGITKLVEMVGPVLHHLTTLIEKLRSVVGRSQRA